MICSIGDMPEPLSNWDLNKVRRALAVAVLALERHKDEAALNQIEEIIEGWARREK
jgi:hypothetical protein